MAFFKKKEEKPEKNQVGREYHPSLITATWAIA